MSRCLEKQLPGGEWDGWPSDWMVGTCTAEAGIRATQAPLGTFNQFVCVNPQHNYVEYCVNPDFNASEAGKAASTYDMFSAVGGMPATLHPVKEKVIAEFVQQSFHSGLAPVSRGSRTHRPNAFEAEEAVFIGDNTRSLSGKADGKGDGKADKKRPQNQFG